MAPKGISPAEKQQRILSFFHRTGLAYTLKDLEKALPPAVPSLHGMQVKDHLQALVDDSRIRVEKIGAGNWYWAFAGEEKRRVKAALARAREDKATLVQGVEALEEKIKSAEAERGGNDDGNGMQERESLELAKKAAAEEVEELKKELKSYAQRDPLEMERKQKETRSAQQDAERLTDEIQSMEAWLRDILTGDREKLLLLLTDVYGDQFDAEDETLREISA